MYNSTFKQKSLEAIKASQQEKKEKKLQILKNSIKSSPRAKKAVKKTKSKPKKKVKEKSMKSINDKVWELCREIIFTLYGNTCYTTGVTDLQGSNRHLSHLIAKASLPISYKYDLRLLRPASYHSNINLSGDTQNYLSNYLRECNQNYTHWEYFRREIKSAPLVKSRDYLTELIEKYKVILEDIKSGKEGISDYKNKYTRLK